MKKLFNALILSLVVISLAANADPDAMYKAYPQERFTIQTGDGYYKQAYHWSFNLQGKGPTVVVFLNHGSGGEWYKSISSLGPCGKDYAKLGDYSGSTYEGLCVASSGQRTHLADFQQHHVPVGPELDKFMKRSMVGSSAFAAWYWQDALVKATDSPVHIFMVGRYNIATEASQLDNTLFWLHNTDPSTVSRDTLPPYNFDGDGLSAIDGDNRPFHASPDISGFDVMYLYKAIKQKWPQLDLSNLIVEGRSNGGSAMIAQVADPQIWPAHIKEYWARNLSNTTDTEPEGVEPALTLQQVVNDPVLAEAFEQMLQQYSRADVLAALNGGHRLQLAAAGELLSATAGQVIGSDGANTNLGNWVFKADEFSSRLTEWAGGDWYQSLKLAHLLYPGCRLDGYMQQNPALTEGGTDSNGNSKYGYKVASKTLFSFAAEDSLYTNACDERVTQASAQTSLSGTLQASNYIVSPTTVSGQVFTPARHGFDYKDVNKNLTTNSTSDRARAGQSRLAIERAVNTALTELGFNPDYKLPENLN